MNADTAQIELPLAGESIFADLDPYVVGRFQLFHAENPHVYTLFRRFANEVLESGRTRFSVNAIFERMRWFYTFEAKGDSFKLNNNYRSCYARMLLSEDKRFVGFFETRKGGAE